MRELDGEKMNFLDWLRENTVENIPFMFFAYNVLFIAALIVITSWLMYKGLI